MINLVINPGSTSTKLALFENEKCLAEKSFSHEAGELNKYESIKDQIPYRMKYVESFLRENNICVTSEEYKNLKSFAPGDNDDHIDRGLLSGKRALDGIMGRGGLISKGLKNGGYLVNDDLFEALSNNKYSSPHASNLGGLLAKILADRFGIKAYIYDAVTSGNLGDVAGITGFKEIKRQSFCHALNMRAMSIEYAKEIGKTLEDINIIAVHLGGGISLAAIEKGKIIDSVGDDEGHFSPERSGSVQLLRFLDTFVSDDSLNTSNRKVNGDAVFSKDDIKKHIRGKGGVSSHLGTSDCREVERMISAGDEYADLVYEALAYQISKSIGIMAIALKGKIDAVILTGGIAYSNDLTDRIKKYSSFLAPIVVKPGEEEMKALGLGILRIERGEEKASDFVIN